MAAFFAGLLIGGFIGVSVMALLNASKQSETEHVIARLLDVSEALSKANRKIAELEDRVKKEDDDGENVP